MYFRNSVLYIPKPKEFREVSVSLPMFSRYSDWEHIQITALDRAAFMVDRDVIRDANGRFSSVSVLKPRF